MSDVALLGEKKPETKEERTQAFPKPPERVYLRPVGYGVEVNGDEVNIGLLISPLKFVQIEMPGPMAVEVLQDLLSALKAGLTAEGKAALIEALTGVVTVT
jgi:hypothetical protein